MKFLSRCLLVLAVAFAFGALLYYTVQALPGASPISPRPGVQLEPQNGNAPQNPVSRPERPENKRRDGPRLRSIAGVIGKTALFSVLVFAAVLGKNFIFAKRGG
jgi:hypothetical protein